jgi:hypothetical protein
MPTHKQTEAHITTTTNTQQHLGNGKLLRGLVGEVVVVKGLERLVGRAHIVVPTQCAAGGVPVSATLRRLLCECFTIVNTAARSSLQRLAVE